MLARSWKLSPLLLLLWVGMVRGVEKQIPVHPHVKTIANGNFDCGLDVEVLLCDFNANLSNFGSYGLAGGLAGRGSAECILSSAIILRELKARGKKTGEKCGAEEAFVVTIHLVAEA